MFDPTLEEKIISRQRVFDGVIIHVDHAVAILPNGRQARREIAVHVGASAVLPVDDQGNAYFVKQYRAPIEQILLEIPAGKLDSRSEDRLLAAKRELREETGLEAENWVHLSDIVTTPGFCDEKISLYLATGLTQFESNPDEDEFVNVVKMPYAQALEMALSGQMADAKSMCAVLAAQPHVQKLLEK